MDKETYYSKLKQIREDYLKKEQELYVEYAKSNNPYSVGDIVEDHMGKLQIESIQFTLLSSRDLPSCVYHGKRLTKKGDIKKSVDHSLAYQVNLIKT